MGAGDAALTTRRPLRRTLTGTGLSHEFRGDTGLRQGAVPAFVGDLVEPVGEALGEAAGVGEHDRRAVRLDEVDDALLDRRPDAAPGVAAGGRTLPLGDDLAELGHVLDGYDDLDLDGLRRRRLHDRHRLPFRHDVPAQEAGDLVDRAHRR